MYIEFSGMPKSGKTTIGDILSHSLKRSNITVKDYHGGGRYSPIEKKNLPSLNLWLANSAIQYILETKEIEYKKDTIHLLDRGLFDRCVFTKALLKMKKIDANTYSRTIYL